MRIFQATTIVSFLTFLVLVAPSKMHAQEVVQALGQARVEYAASDHGVYRRAFHLAKINALNSVVASTFPQAKISLFNQYEDEITAYENIDQFILSAEEIEPPEDTALTQPVGQNDRSIRIKIRATISLGALDAFFQSQSAAAGLAAGQGSEFGVLFFGRRVDARQSFDTRTVQISESDQVESVEVTSGSDGTTSIDGAAVSQTSRTASGGSSTERRAEDTFSPSLSLTYDLGAAIKEELVDAGFEPIEVEDIVEYYDLPYLEDLIDEGLIREDGTMSRRSLNGYKNAALEEGWRFFGMGRVDVGLPQDDSRGTGLLQVPATVSFEVFMDVDGRARSVAVVAPETVWGSDPNGDPNVAEQIAYRAAVELALETVVAQLQAANLY